MKSLRQLAAATVAALLMGSLVSCGADNQSESGDNNTSSANSSTQTSIGLSADLEKYSIIDNGDSITFTDDMDEKVTVPKDPKRVVILNNSYLSLWYLLGGEVIGRIEPSEEKAVPEADNATVVGGLGDPSLEKIISLEPDLVIASATSTQTELATNLRAVGITTVAIDVDSRETYSRMCRIYASLIGDEDLYKRYASDLNAEVEELLSKVPDSKPTYLLMMATTSGVKVKGTDSSNGSMFNDLGAVNIAEVDPTQEVANYSIEQVLEADPEFIFVTEMGSDMDAIKEQREKMIENDPVWSSLRAVKEGKYIILPKEWYTYRPNEDYLRAYTLLACYLYPEVFGEPSDFPNSQQ